MTNTTHQAKSTAAALYVACELSATEWLLTMSRATDAHRLRARVRPGIGWRWSGCWRRPDGGWGWRRMRRCGAAMKRGATDFGRIPVSDDTRRDEPGRRLVEHRGLAPSAAGEDGLTRRGEAAPATAAALGWRTEDVAGRARALTRGGRCAPREPGPDDPAGGAHAISESHPRIAALHGVRRVPPRCAVSRTPGDADGLAGAPLPPGVVARLEETWRLLDRVETERQRARRLEWEQVRGSRHGGATAGPRAGDCRAQRDDPGRGALQAGPAQSTRGGRAHGPGLGAVSEWHDRAGPGDCAEWLPAVRRSRWRSHGPGSDINRPVRSRSGITGALRRRRGDATHRDCGVARRVIIALWRYVEHGIVPEGRC